MPSFNDISVSMKKAQIYSRRKFLKKSGLAITALAGAAIGIDGITGCAFPVNTATGNDGHKLPQGQFMEAHMKAEKIFDTGKVTNQSIK